MSIPTRTNSVDQQLNTQSNANQSFEGSASLHAPVFQLSTAGNGDGQDSDDPLKVSSGQLTFDAEGNDDPDSIYFTRVIHYPPVGNSGVTLGRGYDFGQRSVEQIRGHLTSAGIEESKISILVGAAGLTGDAAAEFVRANKTRVGEITHDQQKILFDIVYAELKADAIRISSKDDVVAKYGATDFENLHPAIMELMVDLRYRGD